MKKIICSIFVCFSLSGNAQCLPFNFDLLIEELAINYSNTPASVDVILFTDYSGIRLSRQESFLSNDTVIFNVYYRYCHDGFLSSMNYININEILNFSHPQYFDLRINLFRDTSTTMFTWDQLPCITYDWLDTCLMSTHFFPYGYNVSLSELTEESISVSPNPARDEIRVQTSDAELIQQLVLQDITGKEVKRVVGNVSKMDVNELPLGTYFLLIRTERGVFRKKVMIE